MLEKVIYPTNSQINKTHYCKKYDKYRTDIDLKIQEYTDFFKRTDQETEIVNLAEEGLEDYVEMLLKHELEQVAFLVEY